MLSEINIGKLNSENLQITEIYKQAFNTTAPITFSLMPAIWHVFILIWVTTTISNGIIKATNFPSACSSVRLPSAC